MSLISLLLTPAVMASDAEGHAPRPVPNGRVLTVGPVEAEFAKLEAEIPGFGGWHFDADGNAVVSLKDAGRKKEAFARIASRVEAQRGQRARGLAVNAPMRYEARQAKYSFLELAAFRDAVFRKFPGGIISVDVDEVDNLLDLEVTDAAEVERVRAFALQRGIPADAVRIEVIEPPKLRTHLFEYHRPLRGGSQFTFRNRENAVSVCTLGLNGVYFNSSSHAGFVTASHCTQYQWTYTGNTAGQASLAQQDLVAQEYDDPEPFTQAQNSFCPIDDPLGEGWENAIGCRWSDAAFYRYLDSARASAWGGATIHTTAYSSATGASTLITGSLPVSGDGHAVEGTVVHKVGATTGETEGWVTATVTDTCVHVNKFANAYPGLEYDVLLLCQDRTNLALDSGDSGAPVYRKFDTHVQWLGILWGGNSVHTWHSPAWAVREDLPNFSY